MNLSVFQQLFYIAILKLFSPEHEEEEESLSGTGGNMS
ncbi:MAG: hypothetical protein ACI8RD_008551 [Bacillariaceae sp.]